MKALKLFLSGLAAVSILSGTTVSAFGEEAENQGISIDIKTGSEDGSLKETDDGIPAGSSMEMDELGRGAVGNDEFLNRGNKTDENYTTIEDWNLKVPTPENSISVLDESTGEFYIYSSGQEGIPYVMIMPFDHSGDGRAFLNDFRDFMITCYADLTVTEEIHQTTIGGYDCWQTRYEYSISGYAAHDRRVAIEHNGMIYMFATKEIPELELTVGDLLEETETPPAARHAPCSLSLQQTARIPTVSCYIFQECIIYIRSRCTMKGNCITESVPCWSP